MLSIDLHCHSTCSDGLMTPAALVARAAERGVDLLALTDHDEVCGLEEARAEAKRQGIEFVSGVEISVLWRNHPLHVVGLRIDPTHPALAAGLGESRDGRIERARRMAAELEKVGIRGSFEGALHYAGRPETVGRAHFARYLVEQGHVRDVKTVFTRYLVKGKPGWVRHQWPAIERAVEWIRESGGMSVLAHPGRYRTTGAEMDELLREFAAMGGDGVEVVSGSHTPDEVARFAEAARRHGLRASVGSDFHGPGESFRDLGHLPPLPADLVPVWRDWPEVR